MPSAYLALERCARACAICRSSINSRCFAFILPDLIYSQFQLRDHRLRKRGFEMPNLMFGVSYHLRGGHLRLRLSRKTPIHSDGIKSSVHAFAKIIESIDGGVLTVVIAA